MLEEEYMDLLVFVVIKAADDEQVGGENCHCSQNAKRKAQNHFNLNVQGHLECLHALFLEGVSSD